MEVKYIGNLDNDGISDLLNLDGDRKNIFSQESNLIDGVIQKYLPERKKIHLSNPEWLKDNTIDVLSNTEICVSFITEGAGHKNSLGYFIYKTKEKPISLSDIKTTYIIFANASKVGSGGNLKTGDTMKLLFSPETKNYEFPVGYSVGFLLFPNGWNGKTIRNDVIPFCSISRLNPERTPELKYHTVCILPEETNKLIIGFEDIYRESLTCDHDFNDCIFTINTKISSVSRNYHVFVDNAPTDNYIKVYKKIFSTIDNKIVECVATLLVPNSSLIYQKIGFFKTQYRTNNAYVFSIVSVNPNSTLFTGDFVGASLNEGFSIYNKSFKYEVGKYVSSDVKESNTHGIYFFYKYDDAARYIF